MAPVKRCSRALVLLLSVASAVLIALPAAAQSNLDGFWNPSYDEDVERIPGEDQGNYTGLPITAAARSVAQSWDPEVVTLPNLQCRPHPAVYGLRGIGLLRIWEDLDPQTLQQTAIHTWLFAWEAQRQIWMDGRAHPPPWAAHSWQGFSVGHWVGDVLAVHTDMIKRAWSRRNGPPTDDTAIMEERFFRYGDVMTYIRMVVDPEYLDEPWITSTNYTRGPNEAMDTYPCREVTEIPRNEGVIPMHLPNQTAVELDWAVRNHIPMQAAQGGAETLLPEYQNTMKTLPPNPPLSTITAREQQEDRSN